MGDHGTLARALLRNTVVTQVSLDFRLSPTINVHHQNDPLLLYLSTSRALRKVEIRYFAKQAFAPTVGPFVDRILDALAQNPHILELDSRRCSLHASPAALTHFFKECKSVQILHLDLDDIVMANGTVPANEPIAQALGANRTLRTLSLSYGKDTVLVDEILEQLETHTTLVRLNLESGKKYPPKGLHSLLESQSTSIRRVTLTSFRVPSIDWMHLSQALRSVDANRMTLTLQCCSLEINESTTVATGRVEIVETNDIDVVNVMLLQSLQLNSHRTERGFFSLYNHSELSTAESPTSSSVRSKHLTLTRLKIDSEWWKCLYTALQSYSYGVSIRLDGSVWDEDATAAFLSSLQHATPRDRGVIRRLSISNAVQNHRCVFQGMGLQQVMFHLLTDSTLDELDVYCYDAYEFSGRNVFDLLREKRLDVCVSRLYLNRMNFNDFIAMMKWLPLSTALKKLQVGDRVGLHGLATSASLMVQSVRQNSGLFHATVERLLNESQLCKVESYCRRNQAVSSFLALVKMQENADENATLTPSLMPSLVVAVRPVPRMALRAMLAYLLFYPARYE
jgi:hypothetical protein